LAGGINVWSLSEALSLQKDLALERNARGKPPARQSDRTQQRHARTLFSVPLTLQYLGAGGMRTTHGISLDVSESGIGALLQSTLSVGDTVGIELELPDRPLNTVAIVRHSSSVRSGFEFVGLTAEERARLAGFAAPA
jgi:hypothetical protein